MTTLQLTGLSAAYGANVVLDGLDLTIGEGSIVAVLGPSGCGKTTLLRIIAGFERPTAGTVSIGDHLVAGPDTWVPPERRRLGIVPQEGALFPHLDVGSNVGFGLQRGDGRDARIAECLELVGLGGFERRRPHELSGGQQQRVALARALAPNPSMVLLDEPFSALDTGLRAQLRDDVREVLVNARATAILVTHDQDEALSIADEVAVLLGDGRIAQMADPITLYRSPVSLPVARFVGDTVTLEGTASPGSTGTHVDCALGVLHTVPDASGPVTVVLRPEQLVVSTTNGTGTAVVTSTRFYGSDATVALTLDDGSTVTARLTGAALPAIGDRVTVTVEGSVVVFPR